MRPFYCSIHFLNRPLQANQNENEQVEIPEHDSITRRKQFQMRRNKKDNKRKKKEEKKGKTGTKDTPPADTEKETESTPPKKKGLTKTGSEKRGPEANPEVNEGVDSKKKVCTSDVEAHVPSDVPSPSKTASPHSKRLKRYRKAKAARRRCLKTDGTGESGKGPNRKKADQEKIKDQKTETEMTKKKKIPKHDQTPEPKPKKAKTSKGQESEKEDVKVDDGVKKLVKAVLEECRDTKCCHPSFEKLDYDGQVYLISPYWTRSHVGVKIDRSFVPNKKAGKGKKCQVAYFGCKTNCTYSNYALAIEYATWPYKPPIYIPLFSCSKIYLDHELGAVRKTLGNLMPHINLRAFYIWSFIVYIWLHKVEPIRKKSGLHRSWPVCVIYRFCMIKEHHQLYIYIYRIFPQQRN